MKQDTLTGAEKRAAAGTQATADRHVSRDEAERLVREHAAAGRIGKALKIQQQIVAASPGRPKPLYRLAMLRLQAGEPAASAEALEQAVGLSPNHPQLLASLCEVLRLQGRLDEAVATGERAHAFGPTRPDVLVNLAAALLDRREAARATPLLEAAVTLNPYLANGHFNLGNAYRAQGRPEAAMEAYRAALRIKPDHVDALSALGLCQRDLGQLAEARASTDKALELAPDHANARLALAILNLLEGRFTEGWRDYEARWGASEMGRRELAIATWQGEPLNERHLFVHAEQGIGDTLQFARYLPQLLSSGVQVTCEVQKAALGILRDSFPHVAFTVRGDPLPAADLRVPLLSLPGHFGTDLSSIPAECPYLAVRAETLAAWRERLDALAPRESLRIGLCWAGSKANRLDVLRSLPVEALAPFLALPNARFFSLQFGARQDEVAGWPGSGEQALIDLAPELGDFAHTAGAVVAMDLIVTVDTATAHLAGALGRPTFLLLAHVPDWRWMLGRGDSPWYPSLALFRQPTPGNWQSPIERAANAAARTAETLIARRENERLGRRRGNDQ